VVGVAAAVTGAFGMNLVNHFEDHGMMFYNVCITIVILMGAIGYGILRKLSSDNII
jgi:Mg2+ and Co2+ transporter CorA